MVPHPPGVQHPGVPLAAQQNGEVWMVAWMAVQRVAAPQGQAKAPDDGSWRGTSAESTPYLHQHQGP